MSQPHDPNPLYGQPSGLNTPPFSSYGAEPTVPLDRVPGFLPADFPAPAGVPPLPPAGPAGPGNGPATATTTRPNRGLATMIVAASLSAVIGAGAGIGSYAFLGGQSPNANAPISVTNTPASTTPKLDGTIAAAAAKIDPSVVTISLRTSQGGGLGTGVVLDTDGHILTNDHVVSGAAQGGNIQVTFDDGSTADATLVGTAPETDLAVIKVAGSSKLQPATFAKSGSLTVGQSVVAMGAPLGLSDTVTSGIVSNTARPVRSGTNNDAVYLAVQTDAAINPGNSGGPLVDLNGSVVGINSAIASTGSAEGSQSGNIGIGFAIPADVATRVATDLIENQTAPRATLGVNLQGAGTEQAPEQGVPLDEVTAGGAADKAGLKPGDVVTDINDFATTTADGLIAATRYYAPGTTVDVSYLRDGQSSTVKVTLGSS